MKNRFHSPFQRLAGTSDSKALTKADSRVTLTGGTEGQGQGEALSTASSAESAFNAQALATALDALVVMFRGFLLRDRESLDSGFEDLVGVLEEWRDEVPKA